MSSMRNAVSRRNHKERAQPEARQKWGLLEKHKDYSLRAKDYNEKKKKLNVLSQKTRERHPDEFAFGMLSADKGTQGKHGRGDQDKNRLGVDAVKLLKTQDSGYLRTVAARGRKEIDRLKEEVQLDSVMKRIKGREHGNGENKIKFDANGQPPTKKRKISQDNDLESMDKISVEEVSGHHSPDERTLVVRNPVDEPEHADHKHGSITALPRSKKQLEREKDISNRLKTEKRRRKLLRERRAAKLLDLKKRQKEILAAADQLDLQRAKMAKSIGGTNKNGVKFKIRERKK